MICKVVLDTIIVAHLSAGFAADQAGPSAMWVTQAWTDRAAVCGHHLMHITILLQACGLQWRSKQKPKKGTGRKVSMLSGIFRGYLRMLPACRKGQTCLYH